MKVCKFGRRIVTSLFKNYSITLLSSLASLTKFLNVEKSSLLKRSLQNRELKQTKPIEHTNFIFATIYSFSCKHQFKLKPWHFHTSRWTPPCRILCGAKKFDHITPLLRGLHRLPIRQKLYFRFAVFKCWRDVLRSIWHLARQKIRRLEKEYKKLSTLGHSTLPHCSWPKDLSI